MYLSVIFRFLGESQAANNRRGAMQIDMADLAKPCPACAGEGMIGEKLGGRGHSRSETCGRCHGKGTLLTPAGEVLKAFVRQYCN